MASPSLQHEKGNSDGFEEEGRAASKASHAGIIRIGFEGISQPHFVEHPCFSNSIETFPGSIMQLWAAARPAAVYDVALRVSCAAGCNSTCKAVAACSTAKSAIIGLRQTHPASPVCARSQTGCAGHIGLSVARSSGAQAHIQGDGPVDGLNHFAHRCPAAAVRNVKPACVTTLGVNQSRVRQGLQHLRKKTLRRIGGRGQVRK